MSLRTMLVSIANYFKGYSTALHLATIEQVVADDYHKAIDAAEVAYNKVKIDIETAVTDEFEAACTMLVRALARAKELEEHGLLSAEKLEIVQDMEALVKKVFGEV